MTALRPGSDVWHVRVVSPARTLADGQVIRAALDPRIVRLVKLAGDRALVEFWRGYRTRQEWVPVAELQPRDL